MTSPPTGDDTAATVDSTPNTDCSDLAQFILSGERIRREIQEVARHVDLEAVTGGIGSCVVDCSPECSTALTKTKNAFWIEFEQTIELQRLSRVIIPQPEETFFISRQTYLVVLEGSVPQFDKLVDPRDCMVFIPVAVIGSPRVIVTEPADSQGKQRTTILTFEVNSVLLIAGRCSISIPDGTKLPCVMLCIWRGST